MNQINATGIRKRLLPNAPLTRSDKTGEIDVVTNAAISYSSEDPEHPIENMFDDRYGAGGTYWASERSDATESLVIEFDQLQTISRLVFEVEDRVLERTQEIRAEVSCDGGRSFRQLFVQEYAFSPRGATFQHEDLRLNVAEVSHLRLTIVPGKNGSGRAMLTSLRLFS